MIHDEESNGTGSDGDNDHECLEIPLLTRTGRSAFGVQPDQTSSRITIIFFLSTQMIRH